MSQYTSNPHHNVIRRDVPAHLTQNSSFSNTDFIVSKIQIHHFIRYVPERLLVVTATSTGLTGTCLASITHFSCDYISNPPKQFPAV